MHTLQSCFSFLKRKYVQPFLFLVLSISLLFSIISLHTTQSTAHADGIPTGEKLWAYGINNNGQLGQGDTNSYQNGVQITALGTNVIQAVAGKTNGFALKTDGTVYGWGKGSGNLGLGSWDNNIYGVTQIPGISNIKQISANLNSSSVLALRADGTVWVWGNSPYNLATPTEQPLDSSGTPLTHIIQVSAGNGYELFLKDDGTVWGIGNNTNGQLGIDSTTTNYWYPMEVLSTSGSGYLSHIVSIDAGNISAFATASDGTVYGWGDNTYEEMGSNTLPDNVCSVGNNTSCAGKPIQIPSLTNIQGVSGENCDPYALQSGGAVWAWGYQTWAPTATSVTSGVSALTEYGNWGCGTGNEEYMMLKNDGTLWEWGNFATWGATISSPVNTGITHVTSVSGGYGYFLTLQTN